MKRKNITIDEESLKILELLRELGLNNSKAIRLGLQALLDQIKGEVSKLN